MNYQKTKRGLDILGSLVLLVILSPLLLLTALCVRVSLGKPVLFRQRRPGFGHESFMLYKFRTMHNLNPQKGLVSDNERMTKFGKFLRSTSLDELPSMWNVFIGDMSFVGPRPLLEEYLARYSPIQARRHETRPGITGLAQVAGRNSISWDEKFQLDVEYVSSYSLKLDLQILFQTVVIVLKREGISHEGDATMPIFTGEQE